MIALLTVAPPALAQEEIRAVPQSRYANPAVTIDQGEELRFTNADLVEHDVVSQQTGADRQPLFRSPLIGFAASGPVEGAQYLTTGSYPFYCSVHSFMTGTLTVTSAGTPQPRPGSPAPTPGPTPAPADTTAPSLGVRLASVRIGSLARTRRLSLTVTVDETAIVALWATARAGRRTITLGRVERLLNAAGAHRVTVTVGAGAARTLRRLRSAVLSVRATARDAAGNRRTARASRTVRR